MKVLAVCVVHEVFANDSTAGKTAIDKRPVDGPVIARELGLDGDTQCNSHVHGGVDKAVYAYDEADAQRWASEVGYEIRPGFFGENLRTEGIACSDAVIGARWAVGGAVLEVVGPRTPCATFQDWTGEKHWVKRFTRRTDTGVYLRVVSPGPVAAGDRIEVVHTPRHGVTAREVFVGRDLERLEVLLRTEPTLGQTVRMKLERALNRNT